MDGKDHGRTNASKNRNLKMQTNNNISIQSSNPSDLLNRTLLETDLLTNGRVSDLALIKYREAVEFKGTPDLGMSSYEEAFPWFVVENGQRIDFNKSIRLFDGIKLISNFLDKKYGLDKNLISEVKLTELVKIFEEKQDITVLKLYDHVANLYIKDQDSFKSKIVEKLSSSETIENISTSHYPEDLNININKPLGKFGDITLNEIATSLKELKWELLLDNAHITINSFPLAVNLLSYTLMLRGYVRYVHNRPYDPSLTLQQKANQMTMRNRNLAFFALVGAPVALIFLTKTAIKNKDIGSINIISSTETTSSSALFLLISNFYKKIPSWVRLVFKLLIVILIVLKLLGFTISLALLYNIYYIKIYVLISSSLVITYQLTNLYLIHRFSTHGINIPKILPDFLINWLKEFEILISSNSSIKEFKNTCYIQIYIYLVIILLILLLV